MTRKKFMKQLMSMGYQKNDAKEIAAFYREEGTPYAEALVVENTCYYLSHATDACMRGLSAALQAISEAACDMAESIRSAFQAIAASISGIDFSQAQDAVRTLLQQCEADQTDDHDEEGADREE